ncbi:conserved hypothetical protein, membrane [Candidatus Magnetomorum sp. HK-1]|nr:conserved hypothetical protein, membrane [Candidatus Magnetomorum sp. HK-1]
MIRYSFIFFILTVLIVSCNVHAGDIDNRLIFEKLNSIENQINETKLQLNQRIDDLRSEFNHRFDDINKRIDDSRTYDIAIIIAILSLMAMILWDRRSALTPLIDQISELKERLDYMWEHFNFGNKKKIITS